MQEPASKRQTTACQKIHLGIRQGQLAQMVLLLLLGRSKGYMSEQTLFRKKFGSINGVGAGSPNPSKENSPAKREEKQHYEGRLTISSEDIKAEGE